VLLHYQGKQEAENCDFSLKCWKLFCQQTQKTHSYYHLVTAEPPFILTRISRMHQTRPTKRVAYSTNMAISEIKGQGWRAIPTQWRKASDILTSTLPGCLFVQQPPNTERDWEDHLNYYRYASIYDRGRQLLHHKTKLNQIQQNTRINLN